MTKSNQRRLAASARLNARLPKQLGERVQKLATRRGETVTDIVQAALELYCAQQERQTSSFEIFSAAGLVGCVDWSPNASTATKNRLTKSLRAKIGGKS